MEFDRVWAWDRLENALVPPYHPREHQETDLYILAAKIFGAVFRGKIKIGPVIYRFVQWYWDCGERQPWRPSKYLFWINYFTALTLVCYCLYRFLWLLFAARQRSRNEQTKTKQSRCELANILRFIRNCFWLSRPNRFCFFFFVWIQVYCVL